MGCSSFKYLLPSKYLCQELLKEFAPNRFCLRHYEFVDFAVFEYGQRTQYLQWRVFSVMIVTLLSAHLFFSEVEVFPSRTPVSRFIYMHIWLSVLAISHNILEILALSWTLYTIPSPILVRIHVTPWYFKCLWFLYNTVYPNIMSCNMAYFLIVRNMEMHIGESRFFLALLASFVGIHVSVTATPSRLAHIIQPLMFNVLHFLFTFIYQAYGFTDNFGENYVYLEIDWFRSRASAVCRALLWLVATCCCHMMMVLCSWFRRIVYRGSRERSSKPVYGFSPEEYYPFTEESAHADYFEIPLNDEADVTCALIQASPPRDSTKYSPHISYREISAQICTMRKASPVRRPRLDRQPVSQTTQIVRKRLRRRRARIHLKQTGNSKNCGSRSRQRREISTKCESRNSASRRTNSGVKGKTSISVIQTRENSTGRNLCCKPRRKSAPAGIPVLPVRCCVATLQTSERSVYSHKLISQPAQPHTSQLVWDRDTIKLEAPAKSTSDEDNDSLSESIQTRWYHHSSMVTGQDDMTQDNFLRS